MNTINLEEHNKVDDLRIQRAISGLTERQLTELRELVAGQQRGDSRAESEAEFGEFDHCVALVDVWLANRSEISLSHDQRNRLVLQFAGGSPDRAMAVSRKIAATSPAGRWFWSTLLAAAAVCFTLASVIWMNQTQSHITEVVNVSADQLRQQMLDDPPKDMLRWVWLPVNSDRNDDQADPFMGDVVWSDILQQGFALLHIDQPVADAALYQLFLYDSLVEDSDSGILCCEFRFDGYATPFVVTIQPGSEVSEPRKFSVQRSIEEPKLTAGPSEFEGIELVAQAADAFTNNQLSDAEETTQQGVNLDEGTETF